MQHDTAGVLAGNAATVAGVQRHSIGAIARRLDNVTTNTPRLVGLTLSMEGGKPFGPRLLLQARLIFSWKSSSIW